MDLPILAARISSIVFIAYILEEWKAHDERVKPICLTRCPGDPPIEFAAGVDGTEFPYGHPTDGFNIPTNVQTPVPISSLFLKTFESLFFVTPTYLLFCSLPAALLPLKGLPFPLYSGCSYVDRSIRQSSDEGIQKILQPFSCSI